MTATHVMLVALLAPLAAAILVPFAARRPNVREAISITAGSVAFGFAAALLAMVADGARPSITLAEPLPGAALVLTAEPFGAMFACLATFLWIVTTIYSIGYMRGHGEKNQTRFYTWFAVAVAAVVGAATAGNLLTLFVCYEILTLSTWPLVTHKGDAKAHRAGRVYLGILLGSSVGLLLLAIIWVHSIAGSGDFVVGGVLAGKLGGDELSAGEATVLFTLFGFGIGKAALMPLHRWLPAAMVAPTPVSALLHAVAVVKTGVFALLKVAVYVFGLDGLTATGATLPIAYVAGFTLLVASIVALTRDNLKERLAYSTIGQLAYITAGTATATVEGVVGAGLHMVTHALGKITLFFAAGALLIAHRSRVSDLTGLGRAMPVTFAALSIAALSIVGVPPLAGMWSKWWLSHGLVGGGYMPLMVVMLIGSLLSAGYLLVIPLRAFARDESVDAPARDDAPLACQVAMTITAAGCVGVVVVLDPLTEMLRTVVE